MAAVEVEKVLADAPDISEKGPPAEVAICQFVVIPVPEAAPTQFKLKLELSQTWIDVFPLTFAVPAAGVPAHVGLV